MDANIKYKSGYCSSCGSVVGVDDMFCRKCGEKIVIVKNNELDIDIEDKSTLFDKYKPGIKLFSVIAFIMILFPPVEWGVRNIRTGQFIVKHSSFYFLIGYADAGQEWRMGQGHINILQLFLQMILALILSIFYQYYNVEIKKWFIKNFQ